MTDNNKIYVDYLDFPPSTWKRPDVPKKIWRVINGRRKMANGEIPRFSIQEVPERMNDDVVEFMFEHFVPNEPLAVSRALDKDPVAVRESRTLWTNLLAQGLSVVALVVNSDPSAKPVIAGVNILGIVTAQDEANDAGAPLPFRTVTMRTIIGVQSDLAKEANVLRRYGVDKYLAAYGLCVDFSFKGQGLGEELLRTRNDIGLAYQIPVTETTFTANTSQYLASRVGFEVLIEKKYDDILDEEGNVAFPGVDVEFLKIMGKRLY